MRELITKYEFLKKSGGCPKQIKKLAGQIAHNGLQKGFSRIHRQPLNKVITKLQPFIENYKIKDQACTLLLSLRQTPFRQGISIPRTLTENETREILKRLLF